MWTVRITDLSIVLFVNGGRYTSTFNRPYEHDVSGNMNADESVTGFTIVHVNQGDDVQLRTHSTYVGNSVCLVMDSANQLLEDSYFTSEDGFHIAY